MHKTVRFTYHIAIFTVITIIGLLQLLTMADILVTHFDPSEFQSTAYGEPSVRLYTRNKSITGEWTIMSKRQAMSDFSLYTQSDRRMTQVPI